MDDALPLQPDAEASAVAPAPRTEAELEEALSRPTDEVIEVLGRLRGDLLVLGAGGKMGLSLASMAVRALRAGGDVRTRVIAVSRFHAGTEAFHAAGIETISLDLLDDGALESLPDAPNVLYLAGMKFGSSGAQPMTWAMNAHLPGLVARRHARSRIVALSTGNVYPFSPLTGPGAREGDEPGPVGEYAITCLGRERIFSYYSERDGTPVTLVRLNYANALRYGVLVDIAQRVAAGEAIDVTMGAVNVIWQGDANAAILRCLETGQSPPFILNVTGPQILQVRRLAERFAELLDVPVPPIVGAEAETALLSDASRMVDRLGPPGMPIEQLMTWTAAWIKTGGALLGKPTGFGVRDGRF